MKQVLRDALDDRGYKDLTPVQTAVLDPDLEGADMLVSAQTGSGKTVGFGLAIAPSLLPDSETFDRADAPLGLVIAPTRELALQVKRELEWLYAKAGAVIASCVGGMDMRDERRALARGAHIVAATPGRLRDHIMRNSIDLTDIRAVVLDEADEMLDLGFREDLEFILGEAPEDRQTLLFSATVPKTIARLAENYQRDAVRVIAKSDTQQHADITYNAMSVADHDTENAVINTLLYHDAPNAIVFANTRAMVNRLTTRLSNRGFKVVSLSGELSQAERTHALQAMRDGRAHVCVATDVAARGIDLPNLDLVVHAELPSNHETMLHRSGRTGRAGRKGVSALIVSKRNRKKAERILGMAKVRADWGTAPSADEVNTRVEDRMLGDDIWQRAIEPSEEATATKLQDSFTPAQLAVAYLRLYRSVRSGPEELADADAKPAPRAEFGPSVWFSINMGRDAGAEPRRILPMVCKAADLTKDDIGAIRVRQDETYIQISEAKVASVTKALGDKMELEPGAILTQMDNPPVLARENHGASPRKAWGNKPPRDKGGFDTQRGEKPAYDKPKFDRPKDKPAYNKPRGDKPNFDKPRSGGYDPSAQHQDAQRRPALAKSTPPVDWNDTPEPRRKKPKPADRKPNDAPRDKPRDKSWGKPNGKPSGKPSGKPGAPPRDGAPSKGPRNASSDRRPPLDPSVVAPKKPRHKDSGGASGPGKPAGKPAGKRAKPHALAAKSSVSLRRGPNGKGPNAKPRRPKP